MSKLLKDGMENNVVVKTTATRKITLDGITANYPVYKVRLDWLYYNDKNDRIATWISKFKSENDGMIPNLEDKEAYNNIVEDFIYQSNPEALKKTQKNIEMFEQREPGVVLNDGRIIDGNRRFTCLRRLSKENEKFNYFETVIIDRDLEADAKQIKMLELSIQHGEEKKVDYNPIDRLVGVYNDLIENKLLTEEEYARSANMTLQEVKKSERIAQLMVEFLEFINAPKKFYIARDLKIDGPLLEMPNMLNKCVTEEEKENLKIALFNNILMLPSGDITRFVRRFKKVIGTKFQDEFLEEQKDLAEEVLEKLPEEGKVSLDIIRDDIRSDAEVQEKLNLSIDKFVEKSNKTKTLSQPLDLAEKSKSNLEDIDTNIIAKMAPESVDKFKKTLDELEQLINSIKENI